MDTIPNELLDRIFSFLPADERKAKYATISKDWQLIVESYTFRSLKVTYQDLASFGQILGSKSRRCALRNLHWRVVLPNQDCDTKVEAVDAIEDDGLTRAILSLLEELNRWEQDWNCIKTAPVLGIDLTVENMDTQSWFTESKRRPLKLNLVRKSPLIGRTVDISHASLSPRIIDGPSILRFASAFKSIRILKIRIYDNEKRDHESRQLRRYEAAQQLLNLPTERLEILNLQIIHSPTSDETFQIASALLPSDPSSDYFSEAIHSASLAPQLKKLYITGFPVISSKIFWPAIDSKGYISRPCLEWVEIEFDMKTPDGDWYFLPGSLEDGNEEGFVDEDEDADSDEGSEGESDEDDNDYWREKRHNEARAREIGEHPSRPVRNIPDKTKVYPFFLAAAKAAVQMPQLRFMSVRTKLANPNRWQCEFMFLGPGLPCRHDCKVTSLGGEGDGDVKVRERWRLYWNVARCKMEEDFVGRWREVGQNKEVEILMVDVQEPE